MTTPLVVGISGPSGGGKSTLADALSKRLPSSSVIQQDWYFKDGIDCPPTANFCEFQWLDIDQFASDVKTLSQGSPVAVPLMDFATFQRKGTQIVQPRPVIIVEGMTIFRVPALAHCFNLRYYMDLNFETLAARKRARDRVERGKSAEVIEAQLRWMAEEYLQDAQIRALPGLILLRGDQPIHVAVAAVMARVGEALTERGPETLF